MIDHFGKPISEIAIQMHNSYRHRVSVRVKGKSKPIVGRSSGLTPYYDNTPEVNELTIKEDWQKDSSITSVWEEDIESIEILD